MFLGSKTHAVFVVFFGGGGFGVFGALGKRYTSSYDHDM